MVSYYQTILSRAHSVSPALVADEALFQSLLVVLVAKQKHLLIRTADDDIPRVMKQIVNILHTLFDLSVVKLRLRQSEDLTPDDFLRLLFLENPLSGFAVSRTSSRKTLYGVNNQPISFRRSVSYPIHSLHDAGSQTHEFDEESNSTPTQYEAHSLTLNVMQREQKHLFRTQTDPIPLLHGTSEIGLLPQVLVVSGLEYTSEEAQNSLWSVMSERIITLGHSTHKSEQRSSFIQGSWTLPEDFFVVYVCPLRDDRERPPIHKSLVDRFPISIEAYPPPESTTSDNRIRPTGIDDPNSNPQRPIISQFELADLRLLATPEHTHINGRADLYLSDLLSAVRHHPHLDGTLITARCRVDTEIILRAWRALFGLPPKSQEHMIPSINVTDEDVRKVFVRAVHHRIRVLDGPRKETLASLIFTTAGDSSSKEEWVGGRRTVKEILKEIIDNV